MVLPSGPTPANKRVFGWKEGRAGRERRGVWAGPEFGPDGEAKIIDVTEENASIRIPNLPEDSNNYVVGVGHALPSEAVRRIGLLTL